MRVLLVDGAGFSPPYDFCLARSLRECGVDVRLIMPEAIEASWLDPDARPPVAQSRLMQASDRALKVIRYTRMIRATIRAIETDAPDVLHVQWLPLPFLDERLIAAAKRRIPVLYTMHNTSSFHEAAHGLRGFRKHAVIQAFDRVIVHSEYSRKSALASQVVSERQVRVVPHGVLDHYRDLTPYSRGTAPVELLFAGSIKYYKGLDVLIEALPTLAAIAPPSSWNLTIAGQPSIAIDSLRARLNALGLNANVRWRLGHQTERELAQLLDACHTVVLPYREIDQSGVLLAAVGMHRPVVASAVGAFPEIIKDGETGLLVPHSDPVALGRALARTVIDTEWRNTCEVAMRKLAETTLNWGAIARQTVGLYSELTAEHRDKR